MVSKRQLKQVYPLTERAHIMVSTMIWVGLINPPFEVPLGQKGVPLSVSLDHRFTSLGAATAFILWKREGKQRWDDHKASVSPHAGHGIPRTGMVAVGNVCLWLCKDVRICGACNSCPTAEPDSRQEFRQECSSSIIQHPACWAFSAANDVSLPSSFRNSSASQPSLHCQVATSVLHLSSQRKNWMAFDQCLLSFLS